jgi:hypothetical protein
MVRLPGDGTASERAMGEATANPTVALGTAAYAIAHVDCASFA